MIYAYSRIKFCIYKSKYSYISVCSNYKYRETINDRFVVSVVVNTHLFIQSRRVPYFVCDNELK